jgi:non-specific protein-tyrosine kinase
MAPVGQPVADLRDYAAIVYARRWLVVIVTLVVALGAWAWTLRQTPIYAAEARVLVMPLQDPLVSAVPINNALSQPNLNTEAQILQSTEVARQVQVMRQISTPTATLLKSLHVDSVTDTDVLVITYRDRDAETAAKIANAFAAAYVEQRTERAQEVVNRVKTSIQDQTAPLRRKITALTEQIGASTDPAEQQVLQGRVDVLLARLQTLQQFLLDLDASSLGAQGGQIVQEAVAPTAPANIHLVRDVALGALAGLVLGLIAAFAADGLDRRVKSREDVPSLMGPMIGAIPRSRRQRSRGPGLVVTTEPRSAASEAYRTLATNVRHTASVHGSKIITVTSALGGEGKTTTAANLAVALAQGGKRVVLVSGDLRHPTVHELLGIENDNGLTNALSDSVRAGDVFKDSTVPNLRVICSGPVPTTRYRCSRGPNSPRSWRSCAGPPIWSSSTRRRCSP